MIFFPSRKHLVFSIKARELKVKTTARHYQLIEPERHQIKSIEIHLLRIFSGLSAKIGSDFHFNSKYILVGKFIKIFRNQH